MKEQTQLTITLKSLPAKAPATHTKQLIELAKRSAT